MKDEKTLRQAYEDLISSETDAKGVEIIRDLDNLHNMAQLPLHLHNFKAPTLAEPLKRVASQASQYNVIPPRVSAVKGRDQWSVITTPPSLINTLATATNNKDDVRGHNLKNIRSNATDFSIKPTNQDKNLLWQAGRSTLHMVLIFGAFLLMDRLQTNLPYFNNTIKLTPVSVSNYYAAVLFTFLTSAILHIRGFYKLSQTKSFANECGIVINTTLLSTAITISILLIIQPNIFLSQMITIFLIPVTMSILLLETGILHYIHHKRWKRGIGVRKLLIVGATDAGAQIMQAAAEKAELCYRVVGYIDDAIRYSPWTIPVRYGNSLKSDNPKVPYLGNLAQLTHLIAEHGVEEVTIALPPEEYQTTRTISAQCQARGVVVSIIPDVPVMKSVNNKIREINDVPISVPSMSPQTGYQYLLKCILDITVAAAVIGMCAIPMLIIAIAIRIESPGAVIFRQTRIGKNGVPFGFYKFRSMYVNANDRLPQLEKYNDTNIAKSIRRNDPRVTQVGRFIRRCGLDEMPQLFNVLMRQMSLVGPRPSVPAQVSRYSPWQYERLEVMPGLTGLWQVNGRDTVDFNEMVQMDIHYVEHWSLWLDIKILFKTFWVVLKAEHGY